MTVLTSDVATTSETYLNNREVQAAAVAALQTEMREIGGERSVLALEARKMFLDGPADILRHGQDVFAGDFEKTLSGSQENFLIYDDIIEGDVDIVVFRDDGEIDEIVSLGEKGGARPFYYRMSEPRFHTLIIRSDLLIVHEITNGPFAPEGTLYAAFAPAEGDPAAAVFQAELIKRAASFQDKHQ